MSGQQGAVPGQQLGEYPLYRNLTHFFVLYANSTACTANRTRLPYSKTTDVKTLYRDLPHMAVPSRSMMPVVLLVSFPLSGMRARMAG